MEQGRRGDERADVTGARAAAGARDEGARASRDVASAGVAGAEADDALSVANNPLGTAPVSRLLLKYTPPAILSMMVSALYNLIDTFFVGHAVGSVGIAATTVAFPLMMIMNAFGAWFGAGGNALAAIKMGEGRMDEADRTMGNAFLMLIVVPIALSAVALVFLDPVLNLLGATDLNRAYSRQFCHIILVGFFVSAVGAGMSNFIRTDGAPSYALVVMVIGTLASVALNYALVMVLGLGMTGSALATVGGQLLTAALVIRYFLSGRSRLRLTWPAIRPSAKVVRGIAAVGLSSFAVNVAASLTASMLNIQITALGPTDPIGADGGLAVIGTVQKVIQILFFVTFGFAIAAQPILGFNYGARQYRRVRKALWITIGAATITNLVLWIPTLLLSSQIMGFFGLSVDLHDFAAHTLVFMTLMFPVVPFQVVGSNYFQATGQPVKAIFLMLTRQLIFYLPFLFLVPRFLPALFPSLTPLAALTAAPSFADACAILVTGVFVIREMRRLSRLVARGDAQGAAVAPSAGGAA